VLIEIVKGAFMKVQIKRFSYFQNIKIASILYFILGFIYIPIGFFMIFFGSDEEKIGGIFFLFMPIILFLCAVIMIPISAAIYNLIAKFVGGVEFTLEEIGSIKELSL
jgi:hypothetical protein